jgi:hypothetical protein
VSIFLGLACCASVILVHLVYMVPAVVIVDCRLVQEVYWPCQFDLCIEVVNIFFDIWEVSSCAASLALVAVRVATVPRLDAVAVVNCAISNCVIASTFLCIVSPHPCLIIILALWKPDCCAVWLVRQNSRCAEVKSILSCVHVCSATALACHVRQASGNNPVLNSSVKATFTILASP